MRTLNARDLKRRMESDEDLLVVNVLDEDAYEQAHIPGSHNVPHNQEIFLSRMEALAGSRDRQIVVYCASKDCKASPKAAEQLERAGFTKVMDFEGGMAEWKLAGFEVEEGLPAGR